MMRQDLNGVLLVMVGHVGDGGVGDGRGDLAVLCACVCVCARARVCVCVGGGGSRKSQPVTRQFRKRHQKIVYCAFEWAGLILESSWPVNY